MVKANIQYDRRRLLEFCRRWKMTRMVFFGSVLREDFRQDSDVDVMVTFSPESDWGLFEIVDMKHELGAIFNRDVDIVEEGTIRNPIKRRCIYENLEVIYES